VSARAVAKEALGRAAASPPLRRRTQAIFADRVNVVYYHYIGEPRPYYADFYSGTTVERLDADLRRLARWFDFAPLSEVVAAGRSARPRLAVTFDDGFDLVATGALDVLERHGVKATTFVMTGCVGNADLMWRNKLSASRALRGPEACVRAYNEVAERYALAPIADAAQLLPASARWPLRRKDELADELWRACGMPPLADFLAEHRPYLGWDDLQAWIARGHEVGHHTRSHPQCARLDADGVRTEIVEPAALLRERLGLDWLAFSYPFGSRLDRGTERELFEQGVFDCALGIRGFAPAGTPPYRLERASAEHHLDFEVFGRAALASLTRR
jgi:peptidoglycan/xylan/chitin deacetylase (PgdA/CDA1 family)